MLTLTASPRTTKTFAPVTLSRRTETAPTQTSAAPRPSFWTSLLRALSAVAV